MKIIDYIKGVFIMVVSLATISTDSIAGDYIPLLEKDKEWGYIDYIRFGHPYEHFTYYRLACGDIKTIEDKSYYEICQYDGYLMPEDAKTVAYMREQDGKVFVRYPSDLEHMAYNYYSTDYDPTPSNPDGIYIGQEHLLYDFNMNEGDCIELPPRYPSDEYVISLKCIETGTIESEGRTRKYLKFDNEASPGSRFWMSYRYIVEGIGPVGDCNFTWPYRAYPFSSYVQNYPNINLLYQREMASIVNDKECSQGKMLYKTPLFDVFGVCDPTVYYWEDGQTNNPKPSSDYNNADGLSLSFYSKDRTDYLISLKEPIKRMIVYNIIGNVINSSEPAGNEFSVIIGNYESGWVLKAETENYTRSFHKYWY